MGNNNSLSVPIDLHPHFTPEIHPIEGEVPLYRLQGESLFLFCLPNESSLFSKLAYTIQGEQHPNLCRYYGNLFMKQTVSYEKSCLCSPSQEQVYNFWVYHNYTLADQANYNLRENVYPDESDLWDLLKCLFQAITALTNFGLFLDLNFKNVQYSPLQKIEVYWGNAKVGNGHRVYYQQVSSEKSAIKEEGLSPEQLKALRLQKLTAKFDLHKCVMHSLGRLLLLYANNTSDYTKIINFQTFQIKTQTINRFLANIKNRYSSKFYRLVARMIEEEPAKRLSFHELESQLEDEPLKNLIDHLSSKKMSIKELCSPADTDSSSKVSVRASQF